MSAGDSIGWVSWLEKNITLECCENNFDLFYQKKGHLLQSWHARCERQDRAAGIGICDLERGDRGCSLCVATGGRIFSASAHAALGYNNKNVQVDLVVNI